MYSTCFGSLASFNHLDLISSANFGLHVGCMHEILNIDNDFAVIVPFFLKWIFQYHLLI